MVRKFARRELVLVRKFLHGCKHSAQYVYIVAVFQKL